MATAVYWIHHPEHTDMLTQGYIGVSSDISRRWESHKNRTQNGRLKNAIKSYGWDTLVKKVILIADRWYCLMVEAKLRSADNIGWNHASGGGCPPDATGNKYRAGMSPYNKGVPWSDEVRAKISASKLGTVPWNKGGKTSDEAKAKQSLAKIGKTSPRKGKTHSEASIEKMRVAHKGKTYTEAAKTNMSKSKTGLKQEIVVCPHCEKVGGKQTMGRWHFNNCKLKGA
jgi:predicted GIY-YIG superfamily endonuclease